MGGGTTEERGNTGYTGGGGGLIALNSPIGRNGGTGGGLAITGLPPTYFAGTTFGTCAYADPIATLPLLPPALPAPSALPAPPALPAAVGTMSYHLALLKSIGFIQTRLFCMTITSEHKVQRHVAHASHATHASHASHALHAPMRKRSYLCVCACGIH